jgi:hypothetical protein
MEGNAPRGHSAVKKLVRNVVERHRPSLLLQVLRSITLHAAYSHFKQETL